MGDIVTKYKIGDVVKFESPYFGKKSYNAKVKKIIKRSGKIRYHMEHELGYGFTWIQDK